MLLAVDRMLTAHPAVQRAVKELRAEGLEPTIVSDFGPELTAEQVDAAAEIARRTQAVAVVGIGGGSVLDAAKMIALLAANTGRTSNWFGLVEPPNRLPELVLVPTTVGTGAEVTRVSMITHEGEKQIASASAFVPALVILDKELVSGLPPPVVASTGLDALAHASESILSTTSTSLTETHAVAAIDLVIANLPAAYDGDVDATGRLLLAAYHAGLSLNAGVVLGHSLGYAINHERPLPHGTTTGLALPYTLAYDQHVETRRGELLSRALTGGRSASLRVAGDDILALVRRVEQPATLDEAGVPAATEEKIARRAVESYPRPTNPEPMDVGRVHALVTAMRTGDLNDAFAVTAAEDAA